MITIRPKVAELTFQLYGRVLHPELFAVLQKRELERAGYRLKLEITNAGHLITWQYKGLILTEVATEASQPLPQRRRLLCYRLSGERKDHVECRGGIRYETTFQLDTLVPEMFLEFQRELGVTSDHKGLIHRFENSGRMALGAMSYLNAELRNRSCLIQCFHTFPDDYAIVKSQTILRLP